MFRSNFDHPGLYLIKWGTQIIRGGKVDFEDGVVACYGQGRENFVASIS